MRFTRAAKIVFVLGLTMAAADVQAGVRKFTYIYEALTMPKGMWEYEQWVTWKTQKTSEPGFDRFDFRHEIEYGITDKLQLALYVADWRYEDRRGKRKGDYRDTAVEVIYNLTNPVSDPVGVSLYGEIQLGDEKFELEGKLILEKDFGPLVLAYNATFEAEWEGHRFDEDKGKIEQVAGVSYQVSPAFTVGAELLHELEMPDFAGIQGKGILYVGPNATYKAERWWVAVTPLFQVSDIDGEVDFQMRMLFGIILGS